MARQLKEPRRKLCAWCGNYFMANMPNVRYCSDRCRDVSQKKKNRECANKHYHDNKTKLEIFDEIIQLELERLAPGVVPGSPKEQRLNKKISQQVDYYRILFLENY